jgi:hypothetical protein
VVNDAVRQMIVLFPSIELAEAFLTFSAGRKIRLVRLTAHEADDLCGRYDWSARDHW